MNTAQARMYVTPAHAQLWLCSWNGCTNYVRAEFGPVVCSTHIGGSPSAGWVYMNHQDMENINFSRWLGVTGNAIRRLHRYASSNDPQRQGADRCLQIGDTTMVVPVHQQGNKQGWVYIHLAELEMVNISFRYGLAQALNEELKQHAQQVTSIHPVSSIPSIHPVSPTQSPNSENSTGRPQRQDPASVNSIDFMSYPHHPTPNPSVNPPSSVSSIEDPQHPTPDPSVNPPSSVSPMDCTEDPQHPTPNPSMQSINLPQVHALTPPGFWQSAPSASSEGANSPVFQFNQCSFIGAMQKE